MSSCYITHSYTYAVNSAVPNKLKLLPFFLISMIYSIHGFTRVYSSIDSQSTRAMNQTSNRIHSKRTYVTQFVWSARILRGCGHRRISLLRLNGNRIFSMVHLYRWCDLRTSIPLSLSSADWQIVGRTAATPRISRSMKGWATAVFETSRTWWNSKCSSEKLANGNIVNLIVSTHRTHRRKRTRATVHAVNHRWGVWLLFEDNWQRRLNRSLRNSLDLCR